MNKTEVLFIGGPCDQNWILVDDQADTVSLEILNKKITYFRQRLLDSEQNEFSIFVLNFYFLDDAETLNKIVSQIKTKTGVTTISSINDVKLTASERNNPKGDFIDYSYTVVRLKEVLRSTKYWHSLTSYQQEALELICTEISSLLHDDPNKVEHWIKIKDHATMVYEILEFIKF